MTPRLLLAASAALAALAAPSADAACYGVHATLVACAYDRPITRQCVYTGTTPCTWYQVDGATCIAVNVLGTPTLRTPAC